MRVGRIAAVCAAHVFFLSNDLLAQTTWRRSYGGYGSDEARSVRETMDGNFVVCGSTGSFGAGGDVYLFLLDPLGDLIWSRTYGGSGVDKGMCVRELPDGGFVVAGITNSFGAGGYDGYLIRTNTVGDTLWTRTYGGPAWDLFRGVDVNADSLYLTGQSFSQGNGDTWTLKVDLEGQLIWEVFDGGAGVDAGWSVSNTIDGGALVSSDTMDNTGDLDSRLLKYNPNGVLEWSFHAGGDSIEHAYGATTAPGGFVMVSETRSFSNTASFLINKVDDFGNAQWQEVLIAAQDYAPREVHALPDGRLYFAGLTSAFGVGGSDAYFLVANDTGAYAYGTTYGSTDYDDAMSVDRCSDGGYVLCGVTDGPGPGSRAAFVVKTDTMGFTTAQVTTPTMDPLNVVSLVAELDVNVNPNPASGVIKINSSASELKCELFNALGEPCLRSDVNQGVTVIDTEGLASGVYILRFWLRSIPVDCRKLIIE